LPHARAMLPRLRQSVRLRSARAFPSGFGLTFWECIQYLDAITRVWGDWALFQRLLTVLRRIGDRHGGVSIANIAVRWVLDHPFVGAVLVGKSQLPYSTSLLHLIHFHFHMLYLRVSPYLKNF
jgi:hypothetical protein